MSEKVYLVSLEGQGDKVITLVTQTVWDWINSDFEGESGGYHEQLSPEMIAEFVKEKIDMTEVFITSGSFDNDRALQAPGKSFNSKKEMIKYVKENDLEIEEEYEGYIY